VPALEALRTGDPALSLEVLEDRASLLFWTWVDAQSRARPGALAKVASAGFVTELQADVDALRNRGRSRVFLQCAVGSVDVQAFDAGPEMTRAAVEIRWSARMGVVAPGTPPGALPVLPQRWIFTLERRAGVRTDADRGMATARCGNCGAPLTDSMEPTCEHCGAPLNDGAHDWVLAQAEPYEIWAARARAVVPTRPRRALGVLFEAVEQAPGGRPRGLRTADAASWVAAFLRSLVMALVDGKVDRQERRMLETTAARPADRAARAALPLRPRLMVSARAFRGGPRRPPCTGG
jgi:hypothetical protein